MWHSRRSIRAYGLRAEPTDDGRTARPLRLHGSLRSLCGRAHVAGAGTLLHGVPVADDVVEAEAPPPRSRVRRGPGIYVLHDPDIGVPVALRAGQPAHPPHLRPAPVRPPVPRWQL